MHVIVRSATHRLLYAADRLVREGHTVELHQPREHFRRAWAGIYAGARPDHWQPHGEAELTLSDCGEDSDLRTLGARTRLFGAESDGGLLRLGGWWSAGTLTSPHWVLAEVGAWPGGGGRKVVSSVALCRSSEAALPLVAAATEHLAPKLPAGWTGLVQLEVLLSQPERPFGALWAGWPAIHHQALFAQQPSLTEALLSGPIVPEGVTFATVISIPPWPSPATRANRPTALAAELSAAARGQLVWHDVELRRGQLWTTGADGLVAVGVARCRFPRRARAVIAEAAAELGLSELQLRSDAGEQAEVGLAALEHLNLV